MSMCVTHHYACDCREESFRHIREALLLIAGDRCSNYTEGHGSCMKYGRSPNAGYLFAKMCDACIAYHALQAIGTEPASEAAAK